MKKKAAPPPFFRSNISVYFPFLYFSQAIRIAMAPLGMIIKLVEPVSEGTSMKRMLMMSRGQMAVPMFLL